jgi:hypothetical protein
VRSEEGEAETQAEPSELERSIRAAWDTGDHPRAIALAVDGYGDELFGYLITRLRDDDSASDRTHFSKDTFELKVEYVAP